uniref:Uncharacterized protein n=1 Tax=Magallana gigas TaxID=29159 RepID=K1PTL2_MAGGI
MATASSLVKEKRYVFCWKEKTLNHTFLKNESEEHMNRLDREIREIERVGKKADRGTIYCACGVLGLVIGLILVFVYIL